MWRYDIQIVGRLVRRCWHRDGRVSYEFRDRFPVRSARIVRVRVNRDRVRHRRCFIRMRPSAVRNVYEEEQDDQSVFAEKVSLLFCRGFCLKINFWPSVFLAVSCIQASCH